MSDHPLVLLLRNSGHEPYRKFVEYHMRRQSIEQLQMAATGATELLPEEIQHLMIEFIDATINAIGYDQHIWKHADVKTAFGLVIQTAIRSLPLENWMRSEQDAYTAENHELAFNLFQIVTGNFAYSASTRRKQRKFMGIRKGFFR